MSGRSWSGVVVDALASAGVTCPVDQRRVTHAVYLPKKEKTVYLCESCARAIMLYLDITEPGHRAVLAPVAQGDA